MGIIVAIVVAVAGAIGVGTKEGVFSKGADTTYRDTVAFEKRALEEKLASLKSEEREVVELTGKDDRAKVASMRLKSKAEKLDAKIQKLEELERSKGWN